MIETGSMPSIAGQGSVLRRASAVVRQARDTLAVWGQRRAGRRDLARLDARLLRDIGLTRAEARIEAAKPFWRL